VKIDAPGGEEKADAPTKDQKRKKTGMEPQNSRGRREWEKGVEGGGERDQDAREGRGMPVSKRTVFQKGMRAKALHKGRTNAAMILGSSHNGKGDI